ncbi:MAG: hypothetical protein WBZ42_00605 [Halobacteriota archaeon]
MSISERKYHTGTALQERGGIVHGRWAARKARAALAATFMVNGKSE